MSRTKYDVIAIAGKSTLYVDSDRIDDCLAYFQANQIDILGINPVRGYKKKDLEFLFRYPDVKKIEVVFPIEKYFDVSPIQSHKSLQSLTISASVAMNLGDLPELEEYRAFWHPELNISGCNNLKILDLSGYKSKTKDLSEFPELPSLVELCLVQAPIVSLLGISRFKTLKRISLAYLSKLKYLSDLEELPGLEELECQVCRNLTEHQSIISLKSLRILRFNDCGEIPTLKFLNELPKLEEFRFVDTNIVDGDLSALLRLKHVGFFNKKHYSHTPEEIDKILEKRLLNRN